MSNAAVGQKLYLCKSNIHVLQHHVLDWPFPDKYSLDIGYSIKGFKFVFENLSDTLKILIEPSQDLINTESGQEEMATVPTNNNFNRNSKGISSNIKNYKNTPITYYINKSYFLYDKSDLIKLNKNSENEIFKIVSQRETIRQRSTKTP